MAPRCRGARVHVAIKLEVQRRVPADGLTVYRILRGQLRHYVKRRFRVPDVDVSLCGVRRTYRIVISGRYAFDKFVNYAASLR